jgi:hypothetical protein
MVKPKMVYVKMGWGSGFVVPAGEGSKLLAILAWAKPVESKGYGKYHRYAPSTDKFEIELIEPESVVTREEDAEIEREYQAEREREKQKETA